VLVIAFDSSAGVSQATGEEFKAVTETSGLLNSYYVQREGWIWREYGRTRLQRQPFALERRWGYSHSKTKSTNQRT